MVGLQFGHNCNFHGVTPYGESSVVMVDRMMNVNVAFAKSVAERRDFVNLSGHYLCGGKGLPVGPKARPRGGRPDKGGWGVLTVQGD